MQFQKHRKSGLPQYGKSMGKHNHFKFIGFSNISGEAEIHTVTKIWGQWIYIVQEKMGKHRDFPYFSLPRRFRVDGNPCNSQYMGMYKFL